MGSRQRKKDNKICVKCKWNMTHKEMNGTVGTGKEEAPFI